MRLNDREQDLARRIEQATGSDRTIDGGLAALVGGDPTTPPDYTASVDRCIDLLHQLLPGWSWHVGWNASGVLPYATLRHDRQRVEAAAATVPLALVKAIIRAYAMRE